MVGEEFNAPDDHSAPTKRDDLASRTLADESTLGASESHQETPASSTGASTKPPETINHFEIRRRLGTGGFGSVYLAHDTKLDRMVALKLLDKLDKRAARRMLADETRAASKLRHPHLVTVFQCGEHDRGCYIVFEHIPGPDLQQARTLREVIKESDNKRLPPGEAVLITRNIAGALAHAHQADIVHRDIKPENILLDDKGSAFLADFGCARRSHLPTSGGRSFVGTFPYMSLEQMEGRWNAQTDIWSLGVVLYEMLRGGRPFAAAENAKSRGAAEAKLKFTATIVGMERPPPIPDVDADLNAICRTCLQMDPERRYKSAAELDEDLSRWQRNEPVSCRRVGIIEQTRRWAQRNRSVAALLTALMLVLAIGFGVSSYFAVQMRHTQQQYVTEQLAQLDQLKAADFDAVITNLGREPFRQIATESLASRWNNTAGTSDSAKQRNWMAVAIVTMQQMEAGKNPDSGLFSAARNHLSAALLTAKTPDDFLLIRKHAAPNGNLQASSEASQRVETLWATAADASDPLVQFRSLCALADYDPGAKAWTVQATNLAQRLLDQDEESIAAWASIVSALAGRLVPKLEAELTSDNEARRTKAAIAYATLASTPSELAKRIVNESSPDVVRELLMQIKSHGTQQALRLLEQIDLSPEDATARQLANLSVYKLSVAGSDAGNQLLMFEHRGEPLARYLFEMDAANYGVDPNALLPWLNRLQSSDSEVKAIQTAVLAMGSTDLEQLPAHQPIVDQVTALYLDHESARVHVAAERVLRQWNIDLPSLENVDQDRARSATRLARRGRRRSGRVRSPRAIDDSWRVNKLGHLMVCVTLPDDSLAEITAHEITFGDYIAYVRSRAEHYGDDARELSWIREPIKRHLYETVGLRNEGTSEATGNPEQQLSESELHLPVRLISALQSVAYCVWVSEQEGVAADQMAFRLRDGLQEENESLLEAIEHQLNELVSPLQTVDARVRGYRLPFSMEWEFLFAMPESIQLAETKLRDSFGWHRGNSQSKIHAVAGKRPHDLGVFDAWGNVSEWCVASLEPSLVAIESLGASYESPLSDIRPVEPGGDVFGGHRAIGFRMIRALE